MITYPLYDQETLWELLPMRFFDVAATVGDCVAMALRDTPGTSGAPGRACYPNFGGLAWDECDCDGSLQIALGRRTVTTNFPQEQNETGANRPTGCGGGTPMQDYTMEFVRCWPRPDNQGRAPSCDSMTAITRKLSMDIFVIRKAMYECLCEIKANRYISDYIVRASQPAGPDGGCAGWVTTFSVEVPTLG